MKSDSHPRTKDPVAVLLPEEKQVRRVFFAVVYSGVWVVGF